MPDISNFSLGWEDEPRRMLTVRGKMLALSPFLQEAVYMSQTANEMPSPWDSSHSNRLIDLCHKGTDLCGQEHFLTGERKAQ